MADASTQFQCRIMTRADAGLVRELFTQVFNQPMTEEFWEWKYGSDRGTATIVTDGDCVVGHYGGVARRVLLCGKEAMAVQITDVMVAPSARHAVRSKSPFYLLFSSFAEKFLGYGNAYPLAFGFPSLRHMKLAAHLGFYAPVDGMAELSWSARRFIGNKLYVCQPITRKNIDVLTPQLNKLWQRCARYMGERIAGIKDAAFIRYRYLDNPAKKYKPLLIRNRLTGSVLGLIVLRDDGEKMFLLDIVAALPAFERLLAVATELAFKNGAQTLMLWCSTSTKHWYCLSESKVGELPIVVPANIWTEGPNPEYLRDRWWLMAGDTDFQ